MMGVYVSHQSKHIHHQSRVQFPLLNCSIIALLLLRIRLNTPTVSWGASRMVCCWRSRTLVSTPGGRTGATSLPAPAIPTWPTPTPGSCLRTPWWSCSALRSTFTVGGNLLLPSSSSPAGRRARWTVSTLRLFSELKQFRENQGGSPQYTINMCFGEKFPDGKALEKKLIVVKVRTSFTFADAGRSPLPCQVTEPLLLFLSPPAGRWSLWYADTSTSSLTWTERRPCTAPTSACRCRTTACTTSSAPCSGCRAPSRRRRSSARLSCHRREVSPGPSQRVTVGVVDTQLSEQAKQLQTHHQHQCLVVKSLRFVSV